MIKLNIQTIEDNTMETISGILDGLNIGLLIIGETVETRAKSLVRVKSGKLRDSITTTIDDGVVTVGSDLDYAEIEEFGGIHTPAHPYLTPAIDTAEAIVETIVATAINGKLRDR